MVKLEAPNFTFSVQIWVLLMITFSIIFLLLSNAVTLRRDKSILYSRVAILVLLYSSLIAYNSLYFSSLENGIGLYGGLFHATTTTHVFHIFIFLISAAILQLTAFYPRKVWIAEYSSISKLFLYNFLYYRSKIVNKMGEQFKIVEYPLILLFIIAGAIFLVSTSDLVSIFLSIELQSYGLYLLSTLYRNSELATSGGLTYFLLGGLSSCFILLGCSLLYANSGTTILDGIYVITSLSDIGNNGHAIGSAIADNLLYWYKPYYINFSLLIMSVGFLFKVSAAPFHIWSPERWFGKSSKTLSSCLRGQLPNSGNTLELKVPSYSWETICGWTNHSDFFFGYLLNKRENKVISLKTSEKRVGYRGSKLVTGLYLFLLVLYSLLIFAPAPYCTLFFYLLYLFGCTVFFNSVTYIRLWFRCSVFLIKKSLWYLSYKFIFYFGFTSGLYFYKNISPGDVHALYSYKKKGFIYSPNEVMGRQTIKNACFLYKSSLIPSKSSLPLLSAIDGSREYSTNSFTVLPSFTPVKVYVNADIDKTLILKENKGKCGIYLPFGFWTNITNGRSYVGSSVNLERRLKCYYNTYFLETAIKKRKSLVYSSLLKHGYSNFTLDILEYCGSSEALQREQYYIDLLKPRYNILLIAGSRLGSKHSEEVKAKISASAKGNKNGTGGL